MSEKSRVPLLFGRFAIPLLVWVIIGPIAAVIAWVLMKKKGLPGKFR